MDIHAFFEEYDVLAQTQSDEELEDLLQKACSRYASENPCDKRGQGALYNELGAFYRGRNRLEDGERAFLKAKEVLETPMKQDECSATSYASYCCECADEQIDLKESADYATTLNNLAGLYRMWGKMEEALELFEQAGILYGRIPNIPAHVFASCYNNKGLVYLDLGMSAEAELCFRKALILIEGVESNDWFYGTTLSNLAFAFIASGDVERACATLREAAERFSRSGVGSQVVVQNCLFMAENLERRR